MFQRQGKGHYSAMKCDVGIGVRAMAKGIVIRVDMAGPKKGWRSA